MSNRLFKISFTGDIMCEKPLLKASYRNAIYNFEPVFANIKEVFSKSDVVIGNLETVLAGSESGYTKELYSFNAPDEFASAVKNAGITYVSTANNHCLDRGTHGLKRTLDVLDQLDIKHFGTARTKEEADDITTIQVGFKEIALIAYTYGTNTEDNNIVLDDDEKYCVNILKSQQNEIRKFKKTLDRGNFRSKLSKIIRKFTTLEQRMKLKAFLGLLTLESKEDGVNDGDIVEKNIKKLIEDIKKAKETCDKVIVCLHSGGLFNKEVGEYTKTIVQQIDDAGADLVVGNHPHVVQKFEQMDNGTLVAYSLGNFSISPSSIYVIRENYPDISVLLHTYFSIDTLELEKVTCSLLKIVEKKNGELSVYEISDLYNSVNGQKRELLFTQAKEVYERFLGKSLDNFTLKEELPIWNKIN